MNFRPTATTSYTSIIMAVPEASKAVIIKPERTVAPLVGEGGVGEGGAMVGAEVLDPPALQTGVYPTNLLAKHEHTPPASHLLMNCP
jgi:hypothetical protein